MEIKAMQKEQFIQHVRDEAARRRSASMPAQSESNAFHTLRLEDITSALVGREPPLNPPASINLALVASPFTQQRNKRFVDANSNHHHLNELLQFEGDDFVEAAFSVILKREPDNDGLHTYRTMLLDGASKVEILGRIINSPEAKTTNATVHGLTTHYLLDRAARLPIIGKLIAIVSSVWNLPNSSRRNRQSFYAVADRISHLERSHDRVTNTVFCALQALETSHNQLADFCRQLTARIQPDDIRLALVRVTAVLNEMQEHWDQKLDKSLFQCEVNTIRLQLSQNQSERKQITDALEDLRHHMSRLSEINAEHADVFADSLSFQKAVNEQYKLLTAAIDSANGAIEFVNKTKANAAEVFALLKAMEQASALRLQELTQSIRYISDTKMDQTAANDMQSGFASRLTEFAGKQAASQNAFVKRVNQIILSVSPTKEHKDKTPPSKRRHVRNTYAT